MVAVNLALEFGTQKVLDTNILPREWVRPSLRLIFMNNLFMLSDKRFMNFSHAEAQ
jgi:hypothetical protein